MDIEAELKYTHYSSEFPVGNLPGGENQTVALRAVVGRVDRTVVFESEDTEGDRYYGGHFEALEMSGGLGGGLSWE